MTAVLRWKHGGTSGAGAGIYKFSTRDVLVPGVNDPHWSPSLGVHLALAFVGTGHDLFHIHRQIFRCPTISRRYPCDP